MNATLEQHDIVYYASAANTADIIGHTGFVQEDGSIRSLIGSFSMPEPSSDDVVIKVDEQQRMLEAFVAAASQTTDPSLRRAVEAFSKTRYLRSRPSDAFLEVFRQVADGHDQVHRVAFYELLTDRPAPSDI